MRRKPQQRDRRGAGDPEAAPGFAGQSRHRYFGSGGSRGQESRHKVRAGQRAQPRADASDCHRPRSDRADGGGRRLSRRRDRLRRRRLELRRHRLPVHRQEAPRQARGARHRGRAGRLPVHDARQIRVRLRRHRASDAARQDAYARIGVHPARFPCRRFALPRHGAAGQPLEGAWPDRSARLSPESLLRGGRSIRAARRASCRPRKRPTRFARRSTKR